MNTETGITNWEDFIDDFFSAYNISISKNEYFTGVSINYKGNGIYILFDLDETKKKILKSEFGRLLNYGSANEEANWIKGIFKSDAQVNNVAFVQTSIDGEDDNIYEAEFNDSKITAITNFLKIPCEIGWTEKEYNLGKNDCYKVIVELSLPSIFNQWVILLKSPAEQDIPLASDGIDGKISTYIRDSFINNYRRHEKIIHIAPINTKNKSTFI